jgi:hypothetical protein
VFDERLRAREDLWWYHQVVSAGCTFLQLPLALVSISTNSSRALIRDTNESVEDWFKRISNINPLYGRNFLLGSQLRGAVQGRDLPKIYLLLKLRLRTLFWK